MMKSNDWKKYILEADSGGFSLKVEDNVIPYGYNTRQLSLVFGMEPIIQSESFPAQFSSSLSTGMAPIIKWPGGKEKELKYILPFAPAFECYYEPFVGGGSVFMGLQAQKYFINDFSAELIELYRCIATSNECFYRCVDAIDRSWKFISAFFKEDGVLVPLYMKFRDDVVSSEQLRAEINHFLHEKRQLLLDTVQEPFRSMNLVLLDELRVNLFRKMSRMKQLERQKQPLPDRDIADNIETALKSALYMNYRTLYNDRNLQAENPVVHCALFFFIRNYAYSGMFRYSSRGEFNVPYGGMAYNNKYAEKKMSYYKSGSLQEHFARTNIYNMDFEQFLLRTQPGENDFVFLDPPYDTEFSTYAQNAFTAHDHERLANFMINKCKAKWMLIIKDTPFIYRLYNREGIRIRSFEKEYLVSFMNRNDKKVTHLLITNY